MQLQITTDHPQREGELRSLRGWLLADDVLARTAPQLGSSQALRDDDMGPVLDILQLVIDGGLGASSLAVAIATWRRSRPEPPVLELRRGDVVVTVRGTDEDVRRIVALLEE